jgi:hypothetical protein
MSPLHLWIQKLPSREATPEHGQLSPKLVVGAADLSDTLNILPRLGTYKDGMKHQYKHHGL